MAGSRTDRRTPLASTILGWLTGRPPSRRRSVAWTWTRRGLFATIIGFVFLLGPGVRLLPVAPGFRKLTDGKNTVYYSPGLEDRARLAARLVREAEHDVLAFWGADTEGGFPFSLDVYVCGSRGAYWRLVMNSAAASASWNDVMLNAGYPVDELASFVRHELSHLHVASEHGWLRSRLRAPAWLDEGIATVLQDSPWQTEPRLAAWLADSAELASARSTPNVVRWLSALPRDRDGTLAQYTYVRYLTTDLLERHGKERVLEFFRDATRTGEHEAAFRGIFGVSLEETEGNWVRDRMARGILPRATRLVDRGLRPLPVVKLVLGPVLLLLSAVWAFRQICRAARKWGQVLHSSILPSPPSRM